MSPVNFRGPAIWTVQPLDRRARSTDGRARRCFPASKSDHQNTANPIDQMKLFELIQIIPSPIRSALRSGDVVNYRISDPTVMVYLRNNSIFAFGQADRARTSATVREIFDAMWLFNSKFERALSKFDEMKAR